MPHSAQYYTVELLQLNIHCMDNTYLVTYISIINIYIYKFTHFQYLHCLVYIIPGAHEPARSVQLRATAFNFERFRHLPYMDISSSGESPFVVAAHTC